MALIQPQINADNADLICVIRVYLRLRQDGHDLVLEIR
jgi:hypothetical protein